MRERDRAVFREYYYTMNFISLLKVIMHLLENYMTEPFFYIFDVI